jgi:hypothetical protein
MALRGGDGTRTRKSEGHRLPRPERLPVSPHPRDEGARVGVLQGPDPGPVLGSGPIRRVRAEHNGRRSWVPSRTRPASFPGWRGCGRVGMSLKSPRCEEALARQRGGFLLGSLDPRGSHLLVDVSTEGFTDHPRDRAVLAFGDGVERVAQVARESYRILVHHFPFSPHAHLLTPSFQPWNYNPAVDCNSPSVGRYHLKATNQRPCQRKDRRRSQLPRRRGSSPSRSTRSSSRRP